MSKLSTVAQTLESELAETTTQVALTEVKAQIMMRMQTHSRQMNVVNFNLIYLKSLRKSIAWKLLSEDTKYSAYWMRQSFLVELERPS